MYTASLTSHVYLCLPVILAIIDEPKTPFCVSIWGDDRIWIVGVFGNTRTCLR